MIKKFLNIAFVVLICSTNIFGQDSDAISNYFKALNYFQQGQYDSALSQLELCSYDINCIELKAKIYFKNQDYTQAINIFKSLLDEKPDEASFYLSLIFADMGFAEESVSWLEKYFEHKNPRFYSKIISYPKFENIAKTSEWREFWQIERYPEDYEKLEDAEYEIRSENYIEAIDILSGVQKITLDYYKNYLIALAYFNLENYYESDIYINKSIKANQKYIDANSLKYRISIANKNYNIAYKQANTLLKLDSYNPVHLYEIAEVANLLARYDEAEKFITEYTSYFDNDAKALLLQAQIFINNNKKTDALLTLNSLIEKNPSQSEYFVLRADLNYESKSWNLAKKDYSMALDINPSQPEVQYKLGMCHYHQNAMKKACHYWSKAAQMKHSEAVRMLQKYCEK